MPGEFIQVCDERPNDGGPRDIVACEQTPEPGIRDIVACDPDWPIAIDCGDEPTLTLTGSTAPDDGSVYVANGGKAPYNWSITGGGSLEPSATTKSATITESTGCGVGSVTVTDSCGNSASIEILYNSGSFTQTGGQISFGDNTPRTCGQGAPCYFTQVVIGEYKYTGELYCAGNNADCGVYTPYSYCVDTTSGDTGGFSSVNFPAALCAAVSTCDSTPQCQGTCDGGDGSVCMMSRGRVPGTNLSKWGC